MNSTDRVSLTLAQVQSITTVIERAMDATKAAEGVLAADQERKAADRERADVARRDRALANALDDVADARDDLVRLHRRRTGAGVGAPPAWAIALYGLSTPYLIDMWYAVPMMIVAVALTFIFLSLGMGDRERTKLRTAQRKARDLTMGWETQ